MKVVSNVICDAYKFNPAVFPADTTGRKRTGVTYNIKGVLFKCPSSVRHDSVREHGMKIH